MKTNEILHNLRIEHDLTLEQVAKRIGTSRQTISRYETGVITAIPYDTILALAEVYDVTPAYIMGWSNRRHGGLVLTKDDLNNNTDDLYELPEYDADGNKIEYTDKEIEEARLYNDAASIRQTLRENRELRMLLSASSKLNKDDLEQLIRLAKLMDKE